MSIFLQTSAKTMHIHIWFWLSASIWNFYHHYDWHVINYNAILNKHRDFYNGISINIKKHKLIKLQQKNQIFLEKFKLTVKEKNNAEEVFKNLPDSNVKNIKLNSVICRQFMNFRNCLLTLSWTNILVVWNFRSHQLKIDLRNGFLLLRV